MPLGSPEGIFLHSPSISNRIQTIKTRQHYTFLITKAYISLRTSIFAHISFGGNIMKREIKILKSSVLVLTALCFMASQNVAAMIEMEEKQLIDTDDKNSITIFVNDIPKTRSFPEGPGFYDTNHSLEYFDWWTASDSGEPSICLIKACKGNAIIYAESTCPTYPPKDPMTLLKASEKLAQKVLELYKKSPTLKINIHGIGYGALVAHQACCLLVPVTREPGIVTAIFIAIASAVISYWINSKLKDKREEKEKWLEEIKAQINNTKARMSKLLQETKIFYLSPYTSDPRLNTRLINKLTLDYPAFSRMPQFNHNALNAQPDSVKSMKSTPRNRTFYDWFCGCCFGCYR